MQRATQLEQRQQLTVELEPESKPGSSSHSAGLIDHSAPSLLDQILESSSTVAAVAGLSRQELETALQAELAAGLTVETGPVQMDDAAILADLDAMLDANPRWRKTVQVVECPLCHRAPCISRMFMGDDFPFGKITKDVEVVG